MLGKTLTVRHLFATWLGAAALVLACTSAIGAPEGTDDPFDRFLAENGLVEASDPAPSGPGMVGQVRDKASEMVLAAMNFLGVPYRRGGSSDDGFDCSGFTRHIFELSLGLALPRRVDEQAAAPGLVAVKRADLKPGDLVFFNTLKRTFSHVGIYIGEGRFIHSPRSGGQVRLEDMRLAYWNKRYTGARRAEPLQAALSDTMATGESAATVPRTASPRRAANAAETARVMY